MLPTIAAEAHIIPPDEAETSLADQCRDFIYREHLPRLVALSPDAAMQTAPLVCLDSSMALGRHARIVGESGGLEFSKAGIAVVVVTGNDALVG